MKETNGLECVSWFMFDLGFNKAGLLPPLNNYSGLVASPAAIKPIPPKNDVSAGII